MPDYRAGCGALCPVPDTALLKDLALARGGCFTRADAVASGWTAHQLRAAVSAGSWARLHPGVFVEKAWYDTLDPRVKHLVDLRARLLVRDTSWCAARRSAAVVHALPLLGLPPKKPLLVRDRHMSTDRGFLREERVNTLPAQECTEVDGIPVTTMARTVADMARDESFRSALVVADAALRSGMAFEELRSVCERCRDWPGAARARRVLAYADGRAESAMESISRAAFLALQVPLPEPQVEVWHRGAFVARVDFLWREQLVVGEADGRVKYATVDDFYAEKRREERLRDLGFEVVRWDWALAYHPERGFAEVLRRAFARGARSALAPGVVLRATEVPRAA